MPRHSLLFIALALAAGTIQAQTLIATPRAYPIVIDQPGHYRLSGPLSVPAQTHGIKIVASNVVLDLNGYAIKGPGFCGTYCPPSGQASGVWINAANVTVRNGSISGFDYAGVFFPNFLVQLEDLTLSDNYQAGAYRHSPPASPKTDTMPAVLRRVMAMRNGAAGVWGYGMTIENSTLSQNFGSGICSVGGNQLFENVIAYNKVYGYCYAGPYGGVAPVDTLRANRLQLNVTSNVATPPSSMGGNLTDTSSF